MGQRNEIEGNKTEEKKEENQLEEKVEIGDNKIEEIVIEEKKEETKLRGKKKKIDITKDIPEVIDTENVDKRGQKLIKRLKIKFVFYFILSYILLIAFCYYISMFDAVYRNTQFLLLQDTFIGFALSMITPFAIYLIPGLFRIPALTAPKKNRRWLYNFSKIFTFL